AVAAAGRVGRAPGRCPVGELPWRNPVRGGRAVSMAGGYFPCRLARMPPYTSSGPPPAADMVMRYGVGRPRQMGRPGQASGSGQPPRRGPLPITLVRLLYFWFHATTS